MTYIFSRIGLIMALLALAACGAREPETITPPKDVAAVVEPFLVALKDGQKAAAKIHVADGAVDELDVQFGQDHARLAKAGKLKPTMIEKSDDGKNATIAYAAKRDGQWTTATVRVTRPDRKAPFKVEYWRITDRDPTLAAGAAETAEAAAVQRKADMIFWGVLALFVGFILALLVWAIRNRTRPGVQNDDPDRRPAASTTRD
jgi:predicted small lipoprotein YifL